MSEIQYGSRKLEILDVENPWSLGYEMFLLGNNKNPYADPFSDNRDEWAHGHSDAKNDFGDILFNTRKLPESCPICGEDLRKPDGNCLSKQCWW